MGTPAAHECPQYDTLATAQIRIFVQERVRQLLPMDGYVHEGGLTVTVHDELEQLIAFVPEKASNLGHQQAIIAFTAMLLIDAAFLWKIFQFHFVIIMQHIFHPNFIWEVIERTIP